MQKHFLRRSWNLIYGGLGRCRIEDIDSLVGLLCFYGSHSVCTKGLLPWRPVEHRSSVKITEFTAVPSCG